jgi:hypothetical protein
MALLGDKTRHAARQSLVTKCDRFFRQLDAIILAAARAAWDAIIHGLAGYGTAQCGRPFDQWRNPAFGAIRSERNAREPLPAKDHFFRHISRRLWEP